MCVVTRHESINFGNEFFDIGEGATANGFLGDNTEPTFYLIDPGRIGWRVMDVIAGSFNQPCLDLRVFMGRVVVDDQVYVEFFWHVGINVSEE